MNKYLHNDDNILLSSYNNMLTTINKVIKWSI